MATSGMSATDPMDTSNQPTSLVTYEPRPFNEVLAGAVIFQQDTSTPISNPPAWLLEIHQHLKDTQANIQHISQAVNQEHRSGLTQLQEQYNALRKAYITAIELHRSGAQATEDQIRAFHDTTTKASQRFAQEVWTALAQYATHQQKRDEAIGHLREETLKQQDELQNLQKKFLQHSQSLETWASRKDYEVNTLLKKAYVDPATLDQHMKDQLEAIRAYTNEAIQIYVSQQAQHLQPTVESVVEEMGRRASEPAETQQGTRRRSLSNRGLDREATRRNAQAAHAQFLGAAPPYMSGASGGRKLAGQDQRRTLWSWTYDDDHRGKEDNEDNAEGVGAGDSEDEDDAGAGGNGGGGKPPQRRQRQDPSPPSSDDGSSDNDDGPENRPRPRRRERHTEEPLSERLLRHAIKKLSQPTPTIQVNKPASFSGKDRSKFRAWWLTIEAYIELHFNSFASDQAKINWLGSFLTETAQEWHQKRVRSLRSLRIRDTWDQYAEALTERFTDPGQRHRDLKAIKALQYKGDISQYLTRLQDLNLSVQWSGTSLQDHIGQAIPNEILKLVYSRRGVLPDTDEDFFDSILEAGQIYENMQEDPGLSKKGESTSRKEHSKRDPRRQPRQRSPSDRAQRSRTPRREHKPADNANQANHWKNNNEALTGISPKTIEKHKKAKAACWRCGRNNHQTLNCYAKKDLDGKEIPSPRVSGAKKRAPDDNPAEEPSPPKKAKAATTSALALPHPRIFEINDDDNDSESEKGFP
jgi:hypothetical protein